MQKIEQQPADPYAIDAARRVEEARCTAATTIGGTVIIGCVALLLLPIPPLFVITVSLCILGLQLTRIRRRLNKMRAD